MLCIISLIPGGSLSSFFNDPTVRNSLNAPSIEEHPYWSGCVPGAGRRRRLERRNQRDLVVLENDRPLSVVPFIAELLDDAHLDILMYNGDLDLAVTAQGTELSLESMEWSGAEGWMDPNATKWHQWIVDGEWSYENVQEPPILDCIQLGTFCACESGTKESRHDRTTVGREITER